MYKEDKKLAINGGEPISLETILIHKPCLEQLDFDAILNSSKTTFVSGDGPDCRVFENKLSEYLNVKHVLFMNSATSALELAFRVKRFKRDGEVLVPNFTYTSTALGALYNQLKIKLVDVDSKTGLIDINKIEDSINDKTVAIAPIDYAGRVADMDSINQIAEKYNLWVVHDTAQSIGSEYKGRKTGSLADVSTFSFHGTKNLTTGEGGAFVTNDDEIASIIRIMREKGTDKYSFLTDNLTRGYYEYVDIGNSYVQSNILGALGVSQLEKLDLMNDKRKGIADFYIDGLSHIKGLQLPVVPKDVKPNWHLFDIHVNANDKYWIMDALRAEGVFANVHYTPLHRNKFYNHLGGDQNFPGTMRFFEGLLRLPIYPSLSLSEANLVVEAVKKIME